MPAGNESLGSRLSGALFQSISARTAGFNSVAVDGLPIASLLSLCVLMFIGGSPGSCAGGIKTTTAVLWLAQLTSRLQGRKWPSALGRHIPGELARRASTLVGVALLWNILGVILLALTEAGNEAAQLRDIMFEQLSAFGTVGLSTGLTAHLSALGKCWIILTMFVGRIGPLTLVVWAFEQRHPGVRLPEGKVMIG
jgi:trk system potassium uptake protein TrkH